MQYLADAYRYAETVVAPFDRIENWFLLRKDGRSPLRRHYGVSGYVEGVSKQESWELDIEWLNIIGASTAIQRYGWLIFDLLCSCKYLLGTRVKCCCSRISKQESWEVDREWLRKEKNNISSRSHSMRQYCNREIRLFDGRVLAH